MLLFRPWRSSLVPLCVLLASLAITDGCRRSGGGDVVARVGSTALSRDEMNRLRADTTVDTKAFLNDWVITELLYQEAERQGVTDDEVVRQQVASATKRLAVAALLDRLIYSDTSGVTDTVLALYYKENLPSFTLQEDVVNISYAQFSDRDAANAFRSRVVSGRNWDEALARLRADSTQSGTVLSTAEHQYFTRGRLHPQELWRLALSMGRGEPSFVLKTDAGFFVLLVHGVQRSGTVAELNYVRNDVRDRILVELRREKYQRLIEDLRSKASVELHGGRAGASAPE